MSTLDREAVFREARAVAQLKHSNIVAIHEVGVDQGSPYLVSDFIDGITMDDWLKSQNPSMRDSAQLIAKIADALHHAHEAGVVHRDVKPGNVMLDARGEPHVTDFGLAKRESQESLTVTGQVLGTPAYMSPEQARGEGHLADRRSDIYAIGVMLFKATTGELPFRGPTGRVMLHQLIHDEPPRPRKLRASIPLELESIMLKCLRKDSSDRYQTAAELAADLRSFLEGEPIKARQLSSFSRLKRVIRRNPGVSALTTALILTLLALLAILIYMLT